MSEDDRQKWDDKWAGALDETYEAHELLTANIELLAGGRALDLACGRGQNAIWLAKKGYRVLGIDISGVALQVAEQDAREEGVSGRVQFRRLDLDRWRPPAEAYDLICVFRFLDRSLFPHLEAALQPPGLLLYSTRHLGFREQRTEANPAYLLERGELKDSFPNLTLIYYREDEENAYLIARR